MAELPPARLPWGATRPEVVPGFIGYKDDRPSYRIAAMADSVNTVYGAIFERCNIVGPAVLVFWDCQFQLFALEEWRNSLWLFEGEKAENPPRGMLRFLECQFYDVNFYGVGFAGRKDFIDQITNAIALGQEFRT